MHIHMHICVYIYVYIYTHIYTHTYTHTYKHMNIHTHMHSHITVYKYMYTYEDTYTQTHKYMYKHRYSCKKESWQNFCLHTANVNFIKKIRNYICYRHYPFMYYHEFRQQSSISQVRVGFFGTIILDLISKLYLNSGLLESNVTINDDLV